MLLPIFSIFDFKILKELSIFVCNVIKELLNIIHNSYEKFDKDFFDYINTQKGYFNKLNTMNLEPKKIKTALENLENKVNYQIIFTKNIDVINCHANTTQLSECQSYPQGDINIYNKQKIDSNLKKYIHNTFGIFMYEEIFKLNNIFIFNYETNNQNDTKMKIPFH